MAEWVGRRGEKAAGSLRPVLQESDIISSYYERWSTETVNLSSKCDYLYMDNMTSKTDRSKLFFFGKIRGKFSYQVKYDIDSQWNRTLQWTSTKRRAVKAVEGAA